MREFRKKKNWENEILTDSDLFGSSTWWSKMFFLYCAIRKWFLRILFEFEQWHVDPLSASSSRDLFAVCIFVPCFDKVARNRFYIDAHAFQFLFVTWNDQFGFHSRCIMEWKVKYLVIIFSGVMLVSTAGKYHLSGPWLINKFKDISPIWKAPRKDVSPVIFSMFYIFANFFSLSLVTNSQSSRSSFLNRSR